MTSRHIVKPKNGQPLSLAMYVVSQQYLLTLITRQHVEREFMFKGVIYIGSSRFAPQPMFSLEGFPGKEAVRLGRFHCS